MSDRWAAFSEDEQAALCVALGECARQRGEDPVRQQLERELLILLSSPVLHLIDTEPQEASP